MPVISKRNSIIKTKLVKPRGRKEQFMLKSLRFTESSKQALTQIICQPFFWEKTEILWYSTPKKGTIKLAK